MITIHGVVFRVLMVGAEGWKL